MSITLVQLQQVNLKYNAVTYNGNTSMDPDADFWKDTPDGGSWVCRDYVLAKSQELRNMSAPLNAMSVVLCWTEPVVPPEQSYNHDGREYHAVLAYVIGNTTWILDSRWDDVYEMGKNEHNYVWDKRQVPGTTNFQAA